MANTSGVFTQLPLTMDAATKSISSTHADPALTEHLDNLNALHRALKNTPAGIPPPPVPVPPQRSAAIEKMRTTGNAAFRKGNYPEAVNMYSHGLTMAQTRPPWEPAPLLKEELQVLFANRAQAYMSMGSWPEALADASCAVDFKKMQNPKAHWRKSKCLKEMGRLEEAREALELGLEFGLDGDLQSLLREVNAMIEKRAH
ncbi:hypothetical protein EDC01DRAFT_119019 [Geopyxis carbonaria]|nr:hypothetical protein EDC01DRAFT_119019 [Geopyxis carbonaria]